MDKLPKHNATNWKQNGFHFWFRDTRENYFRGQKKKLNDFVFQCRNVDKSLMTTLPQLCQQFASLLNRGAGNDRQSDCRAVASRAHPIGFKGTRNIQGPIGLGRPIIGKPPQGALEAPDVDIGTAFDRSQFLAVVENTRTYGRQRNAIQFGVPAGDFEKLVYA